MGRDGRCWIRRSISFVAIVAPQIGFAKIFYCQEIIVSKLLLRRRPLRKLMGRPEAGKRGGMIFSGAACWGEGLALSISGAKGNRRCPVLLRPLLVLHEKRRGM
jgi:hypothetical protein